jgi:hypothetical protein
MEVWIIAAVILAAVFGARWLITRSLNRERLRRRLESL